MKAHRRNGIPTLMLNGGGSSNSYPISQAQPRELPTSPAGRRFYIPGIPARELPDRSPDGRRVYIPGDYDKAESLIRRQFVRDLVPQLNVQFEDMSDDDYETFKQAISPIAGLRSLAKITTPGSREYRDKIASAVGSLSLLPEGFLPQFVDPLKETLGSELSRLSPRLGSPLVEEAAKYSSAREAARQEQEGLAETATTPAGTATTPVETATTSAETAATPAATVAPEGPEAEALRQATGAPTQAEEAAATAATPTGTAAEQPIAIEPDDSVADKLNRILLGEAAKFDERERLKQLKETFGLNLSDMERAAPALAFSFALMGATKEPGESPLQAFIRSAGAAGQSALAQQQALDAKQRSLDAALISPILTERRAAEAIERDREWVTYWDGTTKDDLPNFKSTKMNARQIEEAQKAGIELVPLGLAGSYISQSALVQKARKQAEVDLAKLLREQGEARGKAIEGTVRTVGEGPDKRTVREIMVEVNNQLTPIVYNADPGKSFDRNSMAVNQTVQSVGLVRDMKRSVGEGALGAEGAIRFVEGSIKDFFVGGKGFTLDQTVGALRSAGGVEGDLVWRGDDPAAESLLKRSMGEAYNKDLSAKENYMRFVESTAVFASVTDDQIKELREQAAGVSDDRKRSVYEARIDYLINQRSLAAALAPLLLGESGRTISDADRIRVIQLMGEFADSSKAGLLSRPKVAMRALDNLESVLAQNANKFAKSIRAEVEELDFASKAQVYLARPGDMAYVLTDPVKNSLQRATDSLNAYEKLFPPSGGSSADQNAKPSVHAGSASSLTASK